MAEARRPAGAIVLLVAALTAAGCTPARHKGARRAHDRKNGFSIVPPPGWRKVAAPPGAFMAFAAREQGEFAANLNVNAQPHGGSPAGAFPTQVKPVLEKVFTDYQPADEAFVTIGAKKCYRLCSKFRMGVYRLQNLQYFIVGGNRKVYTLTFTALSADFEEHRPVFEKTALTARTD